MKRKQGFLAMMISAAITFGALFAIVGKPPLMKYHHSIGFCDKAQTEQVQKK